MNMLNVIDNMMKSKHISCRHRIRWSGWIIHFLPVLYPLPRQHGSYRLPRYFRSQPFSTLLFPCWFVSSYGEHFEYGDPANSRLPSGIYMWNVDTPNQYYNFLKEFKTELNFDLLFACTSLVLIFSVRNSQEITIQIYLYQISRQITNRERECTLLGDNFKLSRINIDDVISSTTPESLFFPISNNVEIQCFNQMKNIY